MKLVAFLVLLGCVSMCAAPSPQTASIKLHWEPVQEVVTSPIKIHWGQGPTNIIGWNGTNIAWRSYTNSIMVGVVTNTVVIGLERGKTYYFAFNAVISNQFELVETDYSNEVRYDVPKKPIGSGRLSQQ